VFDCCQRAGLTFWGRILTGRVAKRVNRTLKAQTINVRTFRRFQEARAAVTGFKDRD
jgi:hypothetical protein